MADKILSQEQEVRSQALKIQKELDKKIFFLRTLFETSRELCGIIQPKKIMDTFLLMTMGSLGLTQGLVVLINLKTRKGAVSSRGFSETDSRNLEDNISAVCDAYFPETGIQAGSMPRALVLSRDNIVDHYLFPAQTKVLVLWALNEEYSGLMAFGDKISGEILTEEDIDILLNLTNTLMSVLTHSLFTRNISQLNAELNHKNIELENSLKQVKQVRQDLDKQVFHLQTLQDLASELSPLIETDKLLGTFLLMTMGTFSVSRGFLLVYDRTAKKARVAYRGIDGKTLSPETAEKLLFHSFEASEEKSLAPMSVSFLQDPGAVALENSGLTAHSALMFVVDQSCMGILGFGQTISGRPHTSEDHALLKSYVANFMVYLKNARAFETIQTLNQDLEARNLELQQTIAELKEAMNKITVLERAKAHIKALVQGEVERIGRVRKLDFALIIIGAMLVGLIFNFTSPNGVPLLPEILFKASPPSIALQDAKTLVAANQAILIDARPNEFFSQKHIAGAINVPPALFDFVYLMQLSQLDPQKTLIIYGRTISKRYDEEVADRLLQRDHDDVRMLAGSMDLWDQSSN